MQFIACNTPVDNLGNCLLYAVLNKYTIYLCKSRFAFLDGVGMVYVFLRNWLFTCRCFSFNYIDCFLFSSYLTHVTLLQDSTNEMGWRVWCHARKKNYTVWIMEVYGWWLQKRPVSELNCRVLTSWKSHALKCLRSLVSESLTQNIRARFQREGRIWEKYFWDFFRKERT